MLFLISGGLSGGAIAGIVIGIAAVAIIVALLVYNRERVSNIVSNCRKVKYLNCYCYFAINKTL